ncbi:hypothetical protein AFA91_30225 [Mycolicibacterium goodii]|uniref:Uncharacterized protein n=2 Tax=Mycolicibacterium goodii TaxID=134601 RepID=A0A0K0XDJ5_MYCGD|nr:hypothetical protein AFA91_30225 [Mycolicibacterium goodii]
MFAGYAGRMAERADDRSEEDVDKDENVATSREGGRFVGRAASDDSFDAERSGAEARSQSKDDDR